MTSPVAPTIHLNGTSREQLLDPIADALSAVQTAIDKVIETTPNGRDYYVQGPNALTLAIAEHSARVAKLVAVRDELDAIYQKVDGQ